MTPNEADRIVAEFRRQLVRLTFVISGLEDGSVDDVRETLTALEVQMHDVANAFPGRRGQIEKLIHSMPSNRFS